MRKVFNEKDNDYTMSNKIKAVIFDLYGTLIYNQDTNPYLRLFFELGLSPEEMKRARRIAMSEDFNDLSGLVKRIKPDATALNLQAYEEEVTADVASAVLFPETRKVLEELQKRELKIGLISNLATPYKKSFFNLELEEYFDLVLFSCEVGLYKPDLRVYQRMLSNLECEAPHTLMIGDKKHCDVDPPKALEMQAMLIDRSSKQKPSLQSLEEIFRYL